MIADVNKYLELLGLSDEEANFYLTLLQTGPTTVRKLSETLQIPRTTGYNYFYMLLAKGLVMKLVHKSRTLVAATQPDESLPHLVEQKVQAGKTIQDSLPQILDTLNATYPGKNNKATGEAEITYYKGKNGVRKIYEEALQGSELRLYADLSEIVKVLLPDENDMFGDALAKNPKLRIFEIVADSPESVKMFNLNHTAQSGRYSYKFMPAQIDLDAACILLYDNKVAIINVKENSNSIILHNADYYNISKKLFDFNWSVLPEA